MKLGNKIKASAMQFAILVSVIVALLLSSFLLFTYTYSSFSLQAQRVLHSIEASDKGIVYLSREDVQINDSLELVVDDLPVLLRNKFWGGFQLVHSRGGTGSTAFEKIALLGSGSSGDIPAIFLEDNQLPLVLAGDTHIEGDTYTPQNIIKPGSIAGRYYEGDQLVYGRRYESSKQLPALDAAWMTYAHSMLQFIPDAGEIMFGLVDRTNSFLNERQVIYQEDKIEINESLSGNILIISRREIEVSPFAMLDQVLLVAPKVVFRKGFQGNAHVISKEAVVEENVRLDYPSSIVVFAHKEGELRSEEVYKPNIKIGQKSILEGIILFLNSSEREVHRNNVLIAEDSFIEGIVYCEGYTELKGKLQGSLYTKYFVANQGGSLYINHIYDGQISTDNVKKEIAGLLLTGTGKKVAAWLY